MELGQIGFISSRDHPRTISAKLYDETRNIYKTVQTMSLHFILSWFWLQNKATLAF